MDKTTHFGFKTVNEDDKAAVWPKYSTRWPKNTT